MEMKDYSMAMKYLDTREGDGRVRKREGGWKVKEDRREGKVKKSRDREGSNKSKREREKSSGSYLSNIYWQLGKQPKMYLNK